MKYMRNYHKDDLNNIKIFEDFPEILQIMQYIEKGIQKSKEEGKDNNLIPLLRFTPFLWNKYDGKETENLRKNIVELNKENKLDLDCIKENHLSILLKYQEEVFSLDNSKNNSIKLSTPVKSF